MKRLILILILFAITGCSSTNKPVEPISKYLIPSNETWKTAYGDTLESQMAFNLAVIRNDQKVIFKLVTSQHPGIEEVDTTSQEVE